MSTPRIVAGRYRLKELLGRGGMGRVWLASDLLLCRDVAIKQILVPDGMAMGMREARAAAGVAHPNVVRVYDLVEDGDPWIVMEYLSSRSLQEVIKTSGPVAPGYAATVGLAVLEALACSHQTGILHRDVTPNNILICHDGRIVLADFGLASFADDSAIEEMPLMGTPQFVAPERIDCGLSCPAGDLWSLGVCLYAAVQGRSPFARSSVVDTLEALMTYDPEPPTQAAGLLPVLEGLLRRDPNRRLSSAEVRRHLHCAAMA